MCLKKSICLAAITFAFVSYHSITIATGKRKSDSIHVSVIQHIEELCSGNADSLPFLKKSLDVGRALYMLITSKTPGFYRFRFHPNRQNHLHFFSKIFSASFIGLFLVGYRKLPAAFCTAAGQNRASSAGLHASAETEFSIALYSARLICA